MVARSRLCTVMGRASLCTRVSVWIALIKLFFFSPPLFFHFLSFGMHKTCYYSGLILSAGFGYHLAGFQWSLQYLNPNVFFFFAPPLIFYLLCTRHEGSFMAPSCLWTGTLSVTGQVWRTNLQERSASSYFTNLRRLVFPRYQEAHAPPRTSAPALSYRSEQSSTPLPFKPDNIEFPVNVCCWQGKRVDNWWPNDNVDPVRSEGPHSNGSTVERYQTCYYQPSLFRFLIIYQKENELVPWWELAIQITWRGPVVWELCLVDVCGRGRRSF